jgi:glycosyltransferase involved in cell wall biosynthesis
VYRPQDYDVTLTCAYPFTNWILRTRRHSGKRPVHVFVTQNGDWPAQSDNSEYRCFGCEGLVCTNPDYLETNSKRYFSELIPNGVDVSRFGSETGSRAEFNLPDDTSIVLMVSALIASKQVSSGIDAVSKLPGVHLAVAGDGPLRKELAEKAAALMPGRYHNFTVRPDRMPALYAVADLFLHLSRDESFGNVFIEAMASGLTTVAWDLPRTRWITDSTGRLVANGNQEALVTALRDGLHNGDSKEALSLRALNFSWEKIGGEYESFLMKVLERRAAPLHT